MRREHARPPGDSIGRIVWAGDDAGADDAVVGWEDIGDDLFAEDLEPAIGFARHFFDGAVFECDFGCVFGQDRIGLGLVWLVVNRDGGDIDIEICRILKELAGGVGDAGDIATHIDDGIEMLAGVDEAFDLNKPIVFKRRGVWVSITNKPTDAGGKPRVLGGAMEEGDLMASLDSEFGEGAP